MLNERCEQVCPQRSTMSRSACHQITARSRVRYTKLSFVTSERKIIHLSNLQKLPKISYEMQMKDIVSHKTESINVSFISMIPTSKQLFLGPLFQFPWTETS